MSVSLCLPLLVSVYVFQNNKSLGAYRLEVPSSILNKIDQLMIKVISYITNQFSHSPTLTHTHSIYTITYKHKFDENKKFQVHKIKNTNSS
jgi:hypothetical protein